jgi:hypothetical protein
MDFLMLTQLLERFTSYRDEQFLNTLSPISVTDSGIRTVVKAEHPLNTLLSIEVTVPGIIMLLKFPHPANAYD